MENNLHVLRTQREIPTQEVATLLTVLITDTDSGNPPEGVAFIHHGEGTIIRFSEDAVQDLLYEAIDNGTLTPREAQTASQWFFQASHDDDTVTLYLD